MASLMLFFKPKSVISLYQVTSFLVIKFLLRRLLHGVLAIYTQKWDRTIGVDSAPWDLYEYAVCSFRVKELVLYLFPKTEVRKCFAFIFLLNHFHPCFCHYLDPFNTKFF